MLVEEQSNKQYNTIKHAEIIYTLISIKKMLLMFSVMYVTISCPNIAVTMSKHYVDLNDSSGVLLLLHLRAYGISKHL